MIEYIKGTKYDYKLTKTHEEALHEFDGIKAGGNDYVFLMSSGKLTLQNGYEWDGASGAIDTKSIMRASLVHDGLYQLIREGHLAKGYRKRADRIMYRICRQDGMSWFRAQYVYRAVRWFGRFAI